MPIQAYYNSLTDGNRGKADWLGEILAASTHAFNEPAKMDQSEELTQIRK